MFEYFRMDETHDEHINLYEQIKKEKRPFIEMEVTSLVQMDPPLLT